jgi:drug/metabolite transporter (DMT)-like permease
LRQEALPRRAAGTELRGILITLAAMLVFGLMDAASKYLSTRYPTVQVVWLRYVFTIPLLLATLAPRGVTGFLRSRHPGLQLLRGLLLVTEIGLVVWAFGQLPLVDVHAVLALTPLVVTALSLPLLGEPVGPRRWAAVAVGFLGVLIILRPGSGVLHPAALVALLSVLLYALYQVLTRMVGRADAAETTLLWQLVIGSVALTAVVPFFWRPPEPGHWPLFALLAVLGGVGHFCMIRAFQLAPAVVLQPFSYTLLLWALVIGYLAFGDLPDAWTLLGGAVVVAAGTYTALRERRRQDEA